MANRTGRNLLRSLPGAIALPAGLLLGVLPLAEAMQQEVVPIATTMLAPAPPPNRTDDFECIRERRTIRILVPYSRTFFHIDQGRQKGVSHETGLAFERWLNQRYPSRKGSARWHVIFIPVSRDQLLPSLIRGVGDIAAGGLVEGERAGFDGQVVMASGEFRTEPVLVIGPAGETIASLDDLAGKEVAVPALSNDFWGLVELSRSLSERGLAPIRLLPLAEGIEAEVLLERVNAGALSAAVVDRRVARAWKPTLDSIAIQPLEFSWGGHYAWAVRNGNPELRGVLAAFFNDQQHDSRLVRALDGDRLAAGHFLDEPASADELRRFRRLNQAFIESAERHGLDPLMLMAQAFHESRFDQRARSNRGAVGVMQVLPSTAADPNVRVSGVGSSAEKNVEAASKYLRFLADTYLDDPALTSDNRIFLLLAAYNAGPGNLQKIRRMARENGLDPDRWYGHVEKMAARELGRETLDYVSNVYKYYVAYRFAQEREEMQSESVLGRLEKRG
ncbi:transglycosylase SLT domain-containing protein [Pseudomonas sp. JS3066]|uniref:transglycosylase SLT domain-containing protein n=1 Tax=unclassified Pseudomonas TaxID=196821 RepID=UPI000EAA8C17|nr:MULTISPECIES: transglycosylase SLT domain-containing protein [unclassified Pseudomonas]AYF85824.1 lytic transglycosylase F [Pseudomonas sp. DY-1]MDH4655015.1 transporter substrate-binding domain-containing protein [Pseudomonas sp. BN606]MRK19505.1 transporter substrate-binding domain-containing protein [Pseudomonas sp. JG-B]WVK91589.1 transglycosylase SLT domain-containing protein [Pseudomonas sp. JS3066]